MATSVTMTTVAVGARCTAPMTGKAFLVGKPISRAAPVIRSSQAKESLRVLAETRKAETGLTGVVFEPFQEVQSNLAQVSTPNVSLARQGYHPACEAAINEQINVEYNVSYIYHALYCYFARDTVALPGLAKYFKESSAEEREHAELLMEYQNKRGGRVKLQSIMLPQMEFDHPEKGDALYAMELTLSLEKLTNEKLLQCHQIADQHGDVEMADFIEATFLGEQVDAIKTVSDYVAQLRRIGKGYPVWHWDATLKPGNHAGAGAAGAAP
eukprot:jgi/Mesvir1/15901/Mv02804-RA.1